MGEMKDLIRSVLTEVLEKKSAPSQTVYRDEPILFTASQMKGYTPPVYREMRKIANSRDWRSDLTQDWYIRSENEIFYEQAQFMEAVEDNCPYQGEFIRYYPTYQAMNLQQLRGYFTWRTQVRAGRIERTSLSFAFVYVYELLNQIGVATPKEGFARLQSFATAYSRLDSKMNWYLRLWMKDYIIYYGLEPDLLTQVSDVAFDHALMTLMEYQNAGAERLLNALDELSSYKLKNSSFYKKYPAQVADVLYAVYSNLAAYYDRHRKNSIYEKFFGKMYSGTYHMFNSAVFFQPQKHPDCVYEINPVDRYICKNGQWFSERFFPGKGKNVTIGALLKQVDFCMRERYEYKSTLKPPETTKLFIQAVAEAVDAHMVERARQARPVIEIDVSKLQSIRDTAEVTQSRLIVDAAEQEQPAEPMPVVAAEPTPMPTAAPEKAEVPQQDSMKISPVEAELLACLLDDGDCAGLARKHGLLLSVAVDAINEALFDRFGDTVIEYDGDKPRLIEDYIEELKGMMGQ